MKFTIDAKVMMKALEDIQGKGMYLGDKGFSNSKLGQYVVMELQDTTLSLWNGDTTFGLNLELTVVTAEENGTFIGSAEMIIPYLKKFGGNVNVAYDDFLTITSGNKKASVPAAIQHPNMDAITRIKQMVVDVEFETIPKRLWQFGSAKFEGCFQMISESFSDCMGLCELVKSGVYKLDYDGEGVTLSTENGTANTYKETLTVIQSIGEAATLQFSGPLHKFFKDTPLINFYVKDEFPLLIVGTDRMVVKAPFTRGD